jgi:peptidoglycan/LPS O-acetylase OafA/YrhL
MTTYDGVEPAILMNGSLTSSELTTIKSVALRPRRIPELDGMRGLAITLVLVLHYFVEILRQTDIPWVRTIVRLSSLSWSGVDLFFVLSGFLIGGILLDAKSSPSYYKTFYRRRFFRIVPLYAILTTLFIVGVWLVPANAPRALINIFNGSVPLWAFPFFLQGVFIALHGSFGSAWMGITWSLALQEQFYLLLPVAIRGLNKNKAVAWMASGMIVAAPICQAILQHFPNTEVAIYTLFPCRADTLGWGLLIAVAFRNEAAWAWICGHRRDVVALFAVLGVGIISLALRDQRVYSWMAAFYASLLVLVLTKPSTILARTFRSSVLTWMGTRAYAVYLFHSGMLYLIHFIVFGESPRLVDFKTTCVTLISLAMVLVLSSLSWRFLESPLIRYAQSVHLYRASPPSLIYRPMPQFLGDLMSTSSR